MPSEQKAREAGTTKIENPFSLYQREAREAGETKTPIVQPLSIVRDAGCAEHLEQPRKQHSPSFNHNSFLAPSEHIRQSNRAIGTKAREAGTTKIENPFSLYQP